MSTNYPENCLVIVADGTQAKFFHNSAGDGSLSLQHDSTQEPQALEDDGPAGHRPPESTQQETDEATFAKQLAQTINRRAGNQEFRSLVLVADPQTLGQLRPLLSLEVTERMHSEHAKTLTTSSTDDIVRSLCS